MAPQDRSRPRRWRTFLKGLVAVVVLVAVVAAVWVRGRMQGPHREYRADIEFVSEPTPEGFEVGVSARDITPDLSKFDSWKDVDRDSRFRPDKGDTYEDRNGNGDFDFVWLGGFNINRPAQGVNDPLWARALAFRQGGAVVAVVSVDSIGLTHERFIEPRQELAREFPQLKHVVFTSTHTHNAPDTMGIWSYRPIPSKFNHEYVQFVVRQAKEAVAEAIRGLRPAEATLATADLPPAGFVRDSRQPIVTDRVLSTARFTAAGTEETIATLVSWGNHPEAMGGDNPLVSSDFPHYLREAMERGLEGEAGMKGFGGTCVFLQGPVGGLMTPLGLEVPDRNGRDVHRTNGVGKTRALGENLALRCANLLRSPAARPMKDHRLAVIAKSVFAPIEGTFKVPIMLGLIHPGWYDGKARTEVGVLRVGEIVLLTIPGEIYPEIVDGGVETPEGGDFPGPAVEVPPLRQEMPGALNLVLNLANDEIGYIVPRTQWDTQPPFTYGRKDAPYGEENSGGPDVAQVIHRESLSVLRRLKERVPSPRP
ncbi:MAG: hypothetical protein JNK85_19335 [Verrucomicrobiales bacterium]|nr:hypothetical protein [Verrucomicrobiales bacterium]